MLYSNEKYSMLRKPHGIASTFGQEDSILDFFQNNSDVLENYIQSNNSEFSQIRSYCYLEGYTKESNYKLFVQNQVQSFTKEQEYGLLNRLDNDTGGFLYFAKTPESYISYKTRQKEGLIKKMYLAEVHGNPFFKNTNQELIVQSPIMHHRFDAKKMIVLTTPEDQSKGRGNVHQVKTTIKFLSYNGSTNTSMLLVTISKGIRHQIRVHCKSIGAPIVGDMLYGPKPALSADLHLRSIGLV